MQFANWILMVSFHQARLFRIKKFLSERYSLLPIIRKGRRWKTEVNIKMPPCVPEELRGG
jgi:hypothetical protein